MKFNKNNKIRFGQDHQFFIGIPSGIDFKISRMKLFSTEKHRYVLTAYGYGQLQPYDDKSYGNGSLYPYSLTKKLINLFEKELAAQSKEAAV